MTVKLRSKRSRGIDEVIADARAEITKTEPQLEVEFIQVLQDMINDLSNAPEPIHIKLFASDPALLSDIAPRVGDAISKIPGVVSVERMESRTPSAVLRRTSRSILRSPDAMGFTHKKLQKMLPRFWMV
jgi:Cu/Ag efflux pump CusA